VRITTLGTGHGNPTYCRFNSSTLVEAAGGLYLIDAGAPVHALLIRHGKDWQRLRAAFITHMHEDHVAGLPSMIKMLLKYPTEGMHFQAFLPEAAAIGPLEGWLSAMRLAWPSPLVSLAPLAEGTVYADDAVTVTAIGTRHIRDGDEPISFAYLLEAEGKRALFTGDLTADFADFPPVARTGPCDLLVTEITHVDPAAALAVLKAHPMGRLVLTHVGDPWHGEGEARLKGIFASLPQPFDVAHDGDVFEV